MKICVVSYKFGTPKELGKHLGLYNYFLKELETLTKKGLEIFVVAPWLYWNKKGSTRIGKIKIYRTYPALISQWWLWPINRINRALYFWATQRKVLELCKKEKIDLVYVWQARETGYAISQIKYKLKCPIVFRQITTWCWDFDKTTQEYFTHSLLQRLMNLPVLGKVFTWLFEILREKKTQIDFARSIYRNFDKVLFLSEALMDEAIYKLRMGPYKGEIVPLAIDENIFRTLKNREQIKNKFGWNGNNNILYVGRIHIQKKGLNILLEAFKKVIKSIPQARLYIIGGGSDDQINNLKSLIHRFDLNNKVKFIGSIANELLPKYYNAADLTVVPSIWMEAFGRVIIEAMACGKPVVSTNVGGIGEVNIDGKTGLIVEPDKNQLAQAIIKILKDRNLKEKFGKTARKRVEKYYTYEAVTNRLIDIFKKSINLYHSPDLRVCYFGSYDILYARNRVLMKGLTKNNVRILECNDRSKKLRKFWLLLKQYRKLRKENYDIMFVGFQGQVVMPLAWLLARLDRKKIVFDALFSLYDSAVLDRKEVPKNSFRAKFLYFLDWLACRLADIIIVHTKFHQEFFLKEFNLQHCQDKFRTLYVGVDDEVIFPKPELNPKGEPFIIHFHGSYIPAQGLEHVIIKAAKILKNENIVFNLIGKGQAYPEVRKLAKKWNLTKVNFIDPVPYRVLGEYMNRSDICLGSFGTSPKIKRVVPLKVFEALACGRALITARTPAIEQLLTDRKNCLLTKPGDPWDLADKILELKNNPALKQKIAQNGYQLFKTNLTPKILGAKLKNILINA